MRNQINNLESYWLLNCHVPESLLPKGNWQPNKKGLCLVNIEIEAGSIKTVTVDEAVESSDGFDLAKKIVLPCFVDVHTHLDKGHIWQRSPNKDGTFQTALETARSDYRHWQREDLYRRMEFNLKCAYAHGTKAIRTHLDSFGEQVKISFEVLRDLQQQWQDKLEIQAVSLVSLDYYQTEAGIALADLVKQYGGILGGVAYIQPEIDSQIDTLFKLAKERDLDLDLHVDENDDPDSTCLAKIAEAAIRHDFQGKIVCGHCCSLAVQSPDTASKTIKLVKEAGITVVSLPMCNLYLQDRYYREDKPITPTWRGVTRVHELQQQGISVAMASDNTRDPFYGFGDLDMLEVFQQSVRIAHLDSDYNYWINSVTTTPAGVMAEKATVEPGETADLVVFSGRYYSELLSRSQHDRIVIRQGKAIDTTLPAYCELDDLVGLK